MGHWQCVGPDGLADHLAQPNPTGAGEMTEALEALKSILIAVVSGVVGFGAIWSIIQVGLWYSL